MGKRKRRRRNGPERNGRSKQMPRAATIGNRIRSGFKHLIGSWRWRLVVAIATVLILTVGLWTDWDFVPARASLDALPELDLTQAEPQVAEKIRRLHKEVESNPGSAAAWGKLAMNLDVHDLKREAISCYKNAAELDPTEFRWPFYCATVLREIGSLQALKWFERCQELDPNYPSVHVLYGQMLLDHERLTEALRAFHLALSADRKSTHAFLGLAQIALSQGELKASHGYLLRALEVDPKHGEVHGLLAEVYRRQNEPKKAGREMRIALDFPDITPIRDPLYAELVAQGVSSSWYETRGRAYLERGKYAEAAREFSMGLKARASPEAHNNVGFALQYLGKYEEAGEHYRAALALKPDYRDALNNLATVLFELGDVEESIAHLEKVKRLDPGFPNSYLNLGTFFIRSGQASEAINAFRQGLANAPYDPRTAMKLAWLLATSTEPSLLNGREAVLLAETVCEITDYRVPETLDVLAAAYAEARQFRKAINTARQAYQLALSGSRPALASKIDSHLKFYEAKQPYRE